MSEQHPIVGGKVHICKRPNNSLWKCEFAGKTRRTSTKEESLSKAKATAEDWYLQLRGRLRAGEIKSEKTFREVSAHYLREYDIITQGQRSQRYVDSQRWRSGVHLVPSSGTWASRRSSQERFRNAEFTNSSKQLLSLARAQTPPEDSRCPISRAQCRR
jgi:hypothetical protein